MASKSNVKVFGIKPSSVAMFEGVFAGMIGLGIAILYSLSATFKLAEATDSVLAGFALGMTAGIVAIIVLPLAYFGIGWVFGYLNGWVLNIVLSSSDGIVLDVEQK